VILADPEWRFETFSRETGMDRAADNHYPTSPVEAIKARPVGDIAAADCVLFLWATAPMLPEALAVMAAWGFAYKSQTIWRKAEPAQNGGTRSAGLVLGTGYWFRSAHELLLVGTRGTVPAPAMGTQWPSIVDAPPRRHSEKPDWAYKLIEAYFPSLPKIELNARAARPGWDAWGLEAPDTVSPEVDLPPATGGAAADTSRSTDPVPDDYATALAGALAVVAPGEFHQSSAAPVLRAAYASEPIIGAALIAAHLGHPEGTIRTWTHRLGLTDHQRLTDMAVTRNAAQRAAREATDA
jgi:N6-adenosine-specific RNA methylase IME4